MKSSLFLLILLIFSLLVFVWGVSVGPIDTSPGLLLEAVFSGDRSNQLHNVILNLRIPRLLLSFLAGGSLALAGYLLQMLVTNPLADPYVMGTASGASLGVNIGFLLLPSLTVTFQWSTPVFAFIGAFSVTFLAIMISGRGGIVSPHRLLLAGLALSSLAVACTSFLIFFSSSNEALRKVIFWSLGSFESASWSKIPHLIVVLVICTSIFQALSGNLNLLLLGEHRAGNLGMNVNGFRWIILIGAAALTASSVAVAGPVGFVGLMVPHFVRGVSGIHGRINIVLSVVLGGAFLMTCEIISRIILPTSVLPVGIITSFLGIPFFVYLLSGKNYRIAE